MEDKELRDWSKAAFRELKTYQYKSCKILDRCCRAAMGGAVSIEEFDDPVLMTTYLPKLNFCPECGRKLNTED